MSGRRLRRKVVPSARPGRCRAFTLIELLVVVVVVAALAAVVVSQVDRTRDDAEQVVAAASLQAVADALTGSVAAPGYVEDMKSAPGFRRTEVRVHDLLSPASYPEFESYDPGARRGWRGPYVKSGALVENTDASRRHRFPAAGDRRRHDDASFQERGFFPDGPVSPYGQFGDLVIGDPWGNPIVVQVPPSSAFAGAIEDAGRFRFARVVSAGPDGVLSTPRDRLAGRVPDGSVDARGDDLVLFLNRADAYEDEAP